MNGKPFLAHINPNYRMILSAVDLMASQKSWWPFVVGVIPLNGSEYNPFSDD